MLFLDSSYLIGLLIEKDSLHQNALKLVPYLENENKIINSTVLTEVLNSLKVNNYSYTFDYVLNNLMNVEKLDFLSSEDYMDSIDIFKFYNFSINFSDCTILKSMRTYQINTIVSFYSDFDKIHGIERLFF